MIATHPFKPTQESVLPLWLQAEQAWCSALDAHAPGPEFFVFLHGMLFTHLHPSLGRGLQYVKHFISISWLSLLSQIPYRTISFTSQALTQAWGEGNSCDTRIPLSHLTLCKTHCTAHKPRSNMCPATRLPTLHGKRVKFVSQFIIMSLESFQR